MVFVPPLAIWKMKKMQAFCKHHCAMANAGETVCAIYKMTIKKSLFRNGHLIPNFFIVHLPILV
jgi:hypothetical protein